MSAVLHVDLMDGWITDIRHDEKGYHVLTTGPSGKQWQATRPDIDGAVEIAGIIFKDQRAQLLEEAMATTRLLTNAGEPIVTIQTPDLWPTPPQVIVWGIRFFLRDTTTGRYLETIPYFAQIVDTPPTAAPPATAAAAPVP